MLSALPVSASPEVLVLPFVNDSGGQAWKQVVRSCLRADIPLAPLPTPSHLRSRTADPAVAGEIARKVGAALVLVCAKRATLECSIVSPDGAVLARPTV